MDVYSPINDNARQLCGAIDLDTFRPGPSVEELTERLESLIRFRQRFLPCLRIAPANALFLEYHGNGMAPHFDRGDWMLIDTGTRRFTEETIYAVQFPDVAHVRGGLNIGHVCVTKGGFRMFNQPGHAGSWERFIPHEDVRTLRILGAVRSVFKRV